MENKPESLVASTIIRRQFKQELICKTKKSIELSKIFKYITKEKILIKIDCSSKYLIPGINTSPWILDAVIKIIKQKLPNSKIIVADKIYNNNFKTWGIDEVCKNNDVKLINLAKTKHETIDKIKIPKIFLETDHIISLAPLKTDNNYILFGSIANLFNIFKNNISIESKIKFIKNKLNVSFAIIDATIVFLNDNNIKKTKIMDTIISSNDLLAIDNAICNILCTTYKKINHLEIANKLDFGNPYYKLIGDFSEEKIKLQDKPINNNFIQNFKEFLWYKFKGKQIAKKTIEKNILYTLEFERLIK
jgi:uncharacterized protein (DUF362 family)